MSSQTCDEEVDYETEHFEGAKIHPRIQEMISERSNMIDGKEEGEVSLDHVDHDRFGVFLRGLPYHFSGKDIRNLCFFAGDVIYATIYHSGSGYVEFDNEESESMCIKHLHGKCIVKSAKKRVELFLEKMNFKDFKVMDRIRASSHDRIRRCQEAPLARPAHRRFHPYHHAPSVYPQPRGDRRLSYHHC